MAHHLATGCKFNFELHQPTKCVFTILSELLSAAWSRNLPINFFITLGPFPPTQVMIHTTIFLHFLTFLHYSSIFLFEGDIKTSQKTCCVFGGWVVESNLFFSKRLFNLGRNIFSTNNTKCYLPQHTCQHFIFNFVTQIFFAIFKK
jgi:hypothetical protein